MKKLFLTIAAAVFAVSPVAVADEGNKWHQENIMPNPLIHASAHGNADEINLLFARGTGWNLLNKSNKGGWTPLMAAANNGHVEVVKVLLSAGSNPNAKDKKGRTARNKAKVNGHAEVVKILVAAESRSKSSSNKQTSLPQIIKVADCKLVVWPGEGDYRGAHFVLEKDGDEVFAAKDSLNPSHVDLMSVYCPGIAIRLNQLLK